VYWQWSFWPAEFLKHLGGVAVTRGRKGAYGVAPFRMVAAGACLCTAF